MYHISGQMSLHSTGAHPQMKKTGRLRIYSNLGEAPTSPQQGHEHITTQPHRVGPSERGLICEGDSKGKGWEKMQSGATALAGQQGSDKLRKKGGARTTDR